MNIADIPYKKKNNYVIKKDHSNKVSISDSFRIMYGNFFKYVASKP